MSCRKRPQNIFSQIPPIPNLILSARASGSSSGFVTFPAQIMQSTLSMTSLGHLNSVTSCAIACHNYEGTCHLFQYDASDGTCDACQGMVAVRYPMTGLTVKSVPPAKSVMTDANYLATGEERSLPNFYSCWPWRLDTRLAVPCLKALSAGNVKKKLFSQHWEDKDNDFGPRRSAGWSNQFLYQHQDLRLARILLLSQRPDHSRRIRLIG